jgi:hypothetical protein
MTHANNAGRPRQVVKLLASQLLFWSMLATIYFTKGFVTTGTEPDLFVNLNRVFFFSLAPFSAYCAWTCARQQARQRAALNGLGWLISSAGMGVVCYFTLRFLLGPIRHPLTHVETHVGFLVWAVLSVLISEVGHRTSDAGGSSISTAGWRGVPGGLPRA